jgi:hypothetical protein
MAPDEKGRRREPAAFLRRLGPEGTGLSPSMRPLACARLAAPPVHRPFIAKGLDNPWGGDLEDVFMSLRSLAGYSVAALAGAAMFALPLSPASAFTLSGPSLQQPVASAQIEKVWCRWGRCGYGYGWRGYGWRGGYYGNRWGGYGNCWRGYYGRLHCY